MKSAAFKRKKGNG